ncbi:MAG TPA: hypothetical protein VNJ01_15435 [Bacteriovoracaceae bacterium]|nr:hypothetical protein [Bacteriovoracaceae bacterium]
MFKPTVFLSLLLSFNALADTRNKAIVCPALTSEGSSIVTSIQDLKNLIKPYPECAPIAQKLTEVAQVMTSKEWNKITASLKQETEFDGEDLNTIAALTESASMAINDVIGQVSNNKKCVDGKNSASFMSKLSGVVKGVSTVVGTVSGPYGMAVNLGGTMVSAAITGIDKYFKSQNPYKFSNPDEELLFMNQFCSYAEIQKDINDYLNLDGRPEELESLEGYLKIKQSDLEANCPECKAQGIASRAQQRSSLILNRISEDAGIVPLGREINFTRCKEIHRAVYSADSDLNQFFTLLSKYENPMSSPSDVSLVKEVVASAESLQLIYPKLGACWSLPMEDKQKISRDFNNLIRDELLPLGDSIFRQQMTGFKIRANRKYVNPLGDYMERTLLRRSWIKDQYAEVKRKLSDPDYGSSVQMIITHKKKLEGRIFDELMVDYLKFIQKRNVKQIDQFAKQYQSFVDESLAKYSQVLNSEIESIPQLLRAFDQSPMVEKRSFLSLLKDQQTELDLIITQTSTMDRYCHFLNYMLLSTNKTAATCSEAKGELVSKYAELTDLDELTKGHIAKKFKWLVADRNYQSSRVMDFSIHLREWIDGGNSRWEVKPARETHEQ